MAEENATASGSGQKDGDSNEPPQKIVRLDELEATVAGLIRKNLEEAGLKANAEYAKTSANEGERGRKPIAGLGEP